jgi:hypothetical protein
MAAQADAATHDILIKYDEFQKSCKAILPKIRSETNRGFSDTVPRYSLEIISR